MFHWWWSLNWSDLFDMDGLLSVNIVDVILLVLLSLFGLRGYFKGFFRETFSLAGLIVGFMAAVRYNHTVATLGEEYWRISPFILKGASFVAIFFAFYFFFNLLGWFFHHSEKLLFLQTLNRAGGIAIGVVKGAAVMALIVFFMNSASWIPPTEKFKTSVLIPSFSEFAELIIRVGKERIFTTEDRRVQLLHQARFL
jgi:membrane protein required for colicin V production